MSHPDQAAARSDRRSRLAIRSIAAAAFWLLAAGLAAAQPADQARDHAPRWFFSGAVVLWGAAGTPEDPAGPGYLSPYFHGGVKWPAFGGLGSVGVFLSRNWSLSAELAAHWPKSGSVSEDSRGHTDWTSITSRYREQQTVVSLVTAWHPRPSSSVTLRPVLGATVSRTRQSLTDRAGQYFWYGGTLAASKPDASFPAVQFGGVVGADLQRHSGGRLALTAVVRVHWIRRPKNALPYRDAPAMGPVVLYIGAGACWAR